MSSRSRPLAPSEQKRFLSLEEITALECSLTSISEVIFGECPHFRKDPAAQPKSLATLVLQLQLFMDEVLGEKSQREDRFAVKIPAGFFRDFAHPNGVLKHILVWCLEYRHQQQCGGSAGRRFEVLSDKNREFAINLVQYIWQRLKEEGFWTPPHIFFEGDFNPVLLQRLKDIVTRHNGVLVTDPTKATHRVVPQTVIDPEDTEFYFRAIEQRGSKYFVHWWYRPDSYDTWVMAALTTGLSSSSGGGSSSGTGSGVGSADGLLAPVVPPEGGQWTVSSEWLILLDQYNEWMNEGDFELNNSPSSDQQAEGSEDVVLSEKPSKERSRKEQVTLLSENFNARTEIPRHSGARLSVQNQPAKESSTISTTRVPAEQSVAPSSTHACARRKRSRASGLGSTSRADPVNGHNDNSGDPYYLSTSGPDSAALDSCVSEKLQGVPRCRLSGSGGREKKRSKLPDSVKANDAETASGMSASGSLESEDTTASSSQRYTLQIKLDYLSGLCVATDDHNLVKAMTAAAEALGASPSSALEALQLIAPPLSMESTGGVLHSCTVVRESPALRDAFAAQGSHKLESSSAAATVKDASYSPFPVSDATRQQVLKALVCLRDLDIPVSKAKKEESEDTGLTCPTPSSLAIATTASSSLPITAVVEPKKRKMSPLLMNGRISSDTISVPTTSPSKISLVTAGSIPIGDLPVSLEPTVVSPQNVEHQQRSVLDAPNGAGSNSMSNRFPGFGAAATNNPSAFTEPQRMAPGVVQHPPRSLQSSVAVTPPKELFHLMRSLNPLDPNLSTNILESLMKERDSLSQRLGSAERALRTIMVMWGSRMQPSNSSFSFGHNGDSAFSELPDVPPVVPPLPQEREIVDKLDKTNKAQKHGAHNISLDSGSMPNQATHSSPPTWLTSTAQHLSDFERRHCEEATAVETAETIDMLEETGFHRGEIPENSAVFLPTAAQWFSFDAVHPIEEKQLSVFFYLPTQESQSQHHQDPSTSLVRDALKRDYMTIRNAIIRRYRVNPLRYLTLVHCRQFVEGDAATLLKIHAFLDFWGLINFQALPHTFPTRTRRPMHFRSRPAMHKRQQSSSSSTFLHRSSLTSPSVPHYSSSTLPLVEAEKPQEAKGVPQESSDPIALPNNSTSQAMTRSSGVAHCVACSKLCLYAYYVLKPGNVSGVSTGLIHRAAWCLNCFANGRYPEILTERSFVKITIPLSVCDTEDKWTAVETEKLIEGIELYAEDWESVSRHVATRTPTECVSYFIRLPLEDPLSPTSSPAAHPTQRNCDTTTLAQSNRSNESLSNRWTALFGQTQNPLMAQLKFLCAILGPEVAESAAVAACKSLLNQLERKNTGSSMNKEQNSAHPTPTPTIPGDTVAVANGSTTSNSEEAAEPRQVFLNVKEDDSCVSNAEKYEPQPPTTEDSNHDDDFDDALYKPVTEAHMQEALQSAFKAAILAAERKAREEEGNIRAILRALNNIKEQQLESKIAQFFACDTAIDMATDAVNKKLDHIYQLRDTLRSKIAEATKENQSVLAQYQKERHQKHLQQQQTLQQQLQQKLQLQQQHLQRQLQQLHYQHQFQQNQQQQHHHHHQPPLHHALNGIALQPNLGTLHDRFSDPKHFLMPHLSGLPTVGDSGIPLTPSVVNLPLTHLGNAGGLLQSFVSRAPPSVVTSPHTKPMTESAPSNATLLGAAPCASEPSAARASQQLPAQQLYWSIPR